jgi:hypothetical protein
LRDEVLAARGLPHELRDEPHVVLDVRDRYLGRELDDGIAEPPQHRASEWARVRAGEHDVGFELEELLGGAVVQRVLTRFGREQRLLGIGREPADRENLLGVREREHVLIGADVDRCHRRQRLGGPRCERGRYERWGEQ